MQEMPDLPDVPCLCFDAGPPDDGPGCMCGASERVLRHVLRGQIALTPEQRDWALKQIGAVEGYDSADYVGRADYEVAQGVMSAWLDYARDKGLL